MKIKAGDKYVDFQALIVYKDVKEGRVRPEDVPPLLKSDVDYLFEIKYDI